MRIKVNDLCNVAVGADSQHRRGLPQITIPSLRLRLNVGEAESLVAALQEAIAVATRAADLSGENENRQP